MKTSIVQQERCIYGSAYTIDEYNAVRLEDGEMYCMKSDQKVILACLKLVKEENENPVS